MELTGWAYLRVQLQELLELSGDQGVADPVNNKNRSIYDIWILLLENYRYNDYDYDQIILV
mgnify:FL=1